MTQEEIVKKRQELVHHMFSSTGDEFGAPCFGELPRRGQRIDRRDAAAHERRGV